jgi:DNA repair exonuclease SbcCD ATPase subunit
MGDADKKNFLLQVLNLDKFTKCKKEADDKAKVIESEIQTLKLKISGNQAKIDTYRESVIDEAELKSILVDIGNKIESINNTIVALDATPRPDISKLNLLEQDLDQKYKTVVFARNKRQILHNQYRKVESKILPFNGSSECTSCGSTLDISEAKKHHEQELQKLKQELSSIKQEIDDCDKEVSQEKNLDSLRAKLLDKKMSQTKNRDEADKQIMQLQLQLKLEQKEQKDITLKLQQNQNIVNKIQALTKENQNNINILSHNLNEFEIYKAVSTAFSTTGVQAYVLDSIIDVFNSRIAGYLQFIWSNASYKINTFKETSKGSIVAKLSEQLTMGDSEVSIGSLSGGELRALSICADLAIIDILEQYSGLAMNPIIMDEPFDGLDSVGRELVIELLGNIFSNRCAMIVDHYSEAKAMFSKIIKVEKRLGISSVTTDS